MLTPVLRLTAVAAVLALPGLALAQDKYTIKQAETPIPDKVAKPVAELLGPKSVQFLDAKGELIFELWFRKELPSTGTAQQAKSGLTYQEIPETTLVGVIRFARTATDYRKQKIKEGVYTMRLANQPSDGDHMGTAPFKEFVLLIPAADDKNPGPLKDAKTLHEESTRATGSSHPGVLLLFPGKDPGDAPKLMSMPDNHWVLMWKQEVKTKDVKATMPFGLTLIGVSAGV
jgi:hypothetical protein